MGSRQFGLEVVMLYPLKPYSVGYPILCYRMGDSSTSALLNADHHVKRTWDTIRKAGRMFDMSLHLDAGLASLIR